MVKIKKNMLGFTLTELLITVVIVGVLASVAYPSYVDSVRKARRSDATSTLLAIQLGIEKNRVSNIDYGSSLPVSNSGASYPSTNGYYTITYGATTASVFSVTAAPVTGTEQANDTCVNFVIDQNGPVLNTAADRACWGL